MLRFLQHNDQFIESPVLPTPLRPQCAVRHLACCPHASPPTRLQHADQLAGWHVPRPTRLQPLVRRVVVVVLVVVVGFRALQDHPLLPPGLGKWYPSRKVLYEQFN